MFTYRQRMLMPSDQCAFANGGMTLQKAVRGRLTAEEWKPLIASSLIYEFSPDIPRKLYKQRAVRIAPGFIAAFLPPILLRLFLPGITLPSLAVLGYFFLVLFLYSTFFWDIGLLRKQLRLKADMKAAEFFGRTSFLHTLGKLDAMRLTDVEERKQEKLGWTLHRTPFPSITQRIDNLQRDRKTH